jgi:hypothetical protein
MRCMNSKSHAVIYSRRQTIRSFITADQVSDYTGARAALVIFPNADWLVRDRKYLLRSNYTKPTIR